MDEAEKKVAKAKTSLLLKHPFYAMLLLGLEEDWNVEKHGVKTCGVWPGSIYFNRDWIATLPVDELEGVLCHRLRSSMRFMTETWRSPS